jgi:hypothetical protein
MLHVGENFYSLLTSLLSFICLKTTLRAKLLKNWWITADSALNSGKS